MFSFVFTKHLLILIVIVKTTIICPNFSYSSQPPKHHQIKRLVCDLNFLVDLKFRTS